MKLVVVVTVTVMAVTAEPGALGVIEKVAEGSANYVVDLLCGCGCRKDLLELERFYILSKI